MNETFYKNLDCLENLYEITQKDFYNDVPNIWYVLASDIVNSTDSINNGK